MIRRQDGQVMVAGVGISLLLIAAALVLVHLAAIRAQGGHGQTAADVAALAAARVLSQDPTASASQAIAAAGTAARANGAHLSRFQIDRSSGIPTAVDVQVTETAAGDVPGSGRRRDAVTLTSRAAVVYPAAPAPGAPLPVNLAGSRGAAAVVRAAEAQIGWPYVWGGESRAEGGFDCSGLVDYAYSAAGLSLPGRPTSESLWSMSQHISEAELAPGDLVFLGAAGGAPYHVGLYAGGGMAVVAPHTGAFVELEPLSAVGWDGFGRLIRGNAATAAPVTGSTEDLARKYDVPPTVLEAAERAGADRSPVDLAQRLSAAMREHGGNVVDALAQVLGSRQAAGAVMAAVSDEPPAESSVELVPRTAIRWRGPGGGGGALDELVRIGRLVTRANHTYSQVSDEDASPRGRAGGLALLAIFLLGFLHVGSAGLQLGLSLLQQAQALAGNALRLFGVLGDGIQPLARASGVWGRAIPWLDVGISLVGLSSAVRGLFHADRWGTSHGRVAYLGLVAASGLSLVASVAYSVAVTFGLVLISPEVIAAMLLVGGVVGTGIVVWQNFDRIRQAAEWMGRGLIDPWRKQYQWSEQGAEFLWHHAPASARSDAGVVLRAARRVTRGLTQPVQTVLSRGTSLLHAAGSRLLGLG